ncbi:asparagine synthetase domain-containing protein 1-like isoform X2 [Chenopodium quinoa]|uniref:asparagine synthetase domain-containing protein 1-like isoform X2 n=1 Tax=Chenopodium quinoa TaxID=63459 RepID=UPI000B770B67|nr:asparagine synthetase domain-containing protein 1-like isoform X2 [Chenopodium quinoa]
MCGISLIVDGICFDLSSINTIQQSSSDATFEQYTFAIDDLKAGLRRRGPDSLGTKKVILEVKDAEVHSYVARDKETEREISCLRAMRDCKPFSDGDSGSGMQQSVAEMCFVGAVLQLRGTKPVVQPLVSATGNVLIYNGEIYDGLYVSCDSNDTNVLLQSLEDCCCCQSHENVSSCSGKPIPELLSSIKGPWAAIYWQAASRTLWFGRDALGRRSLLVHWPTSEDSRLVLSSVSPACTSQEPDSEVEGRASNITYWEELPCGVYSIAVDATEAGACLAGKIRKHEWMNYMLKDLIKWERKLIEPKLMEFNSSNCSSLLGNSDIHSASCNGTLHSSSISPADRVLAALRKSITRRSTQNTIYKEALHDGRENSVPVAILFSGGLDSMILAAILHECLDAGYDIDLLNVSFNGEAAPDRITSRAGLKELERIAPLRRWRLVEIDADLSNLTMEMKQVMALINPAKTYMDLNIGIALWLASGGDGWVHELDTSAPHEGYQRFRYKSEARILLVGSGADEQCAGYGRHRTKYRNSSWLGLHEEMKLDMQRIWKRNLGRDDRCIADNGKEARFPFLDEDVIRILLDFPLWEIANLNQPSGKGDKKILREVARLLGLHEAAVQPKRAIQFGSRIAQESNRKNFGSNRAANQASAGSVAFHKSSS